MLGVGEKKKVPFIDYFKWRMNEWMSESMNKQIKHVDFKLLKVRALLKLIANVSHSALLTVDI